MAIDDDLLSDDEYVRRIQRRFRIRTKRVLPTFAVRRGVPSQRDVIALAGVIRRAEDERSIQKHLEANPHLISAHLRGGHGRWVIPQKRLGAEYVPDFLLAECSSIGMEWEAVELESPKAAIFKKNGDLSQVVNHALDQVAHWRTWLRRNVSYAQRELGLVDIDGAEISALVLVGRRDRGTEPKVELRRQRALEGTTIHTYEWLLETLSRQTWDAAVGSIVVRRPKTRRTALKRAAKRVMPKK